MDVCLRSFEFRLWAEGPLGFRRGDVSVVGLRLVLQVLMSEKLRVQSSVLWLSVLWVWVRGG